MVVAPGIADMELGGNGPVVWERTRSALELGLNRDFSARDFALRAQNGGGVVADD